MEEQDVVAFIARTGLYMEIAVEQITGSGELGVRSFHCEMIFVDGNQNCGMRLVLCSC